MRQRQGRTFQSSGFSAKGTSVRGYQFLRLSLRGDKKGKLISRTIKSQNTIVRVQVDVLGSLTIRTVTVDVKQHWNITSELKSCVKVEGGRPGLAVPNTIVRTA